jgi:osmotically-inducible protein OsmY
MFKQNQTLRPIPAAATAAAIAGANDASMNANISQEVIDARQETQIWTTFALSPYLRCNDIMVSVREGRVILSGTVSDAVSKDLAKQIALGIKGIEAVDNRIDVHTNYQPPVKSAERDFSEMVDDAAVTSKVRSKILWSSYADRLTVNVDTRRGCVILSGTAENAEAKEFVGKLATNTHGVNSVDNQLEIQAMKPATTTHGDNTDFADTLITTKVKWTFLHSSNVDSADISVSTHDGVVKLTGQTNGGARRALAIELATNVRGVKSVDATSLVM